MGISEDKLKENVYDLNSKTTKCIKCFGSSCNCSTYFIPGAYAGGLDAATDKANEVKTWLYGFILVATLIYAMYCIIMALMHRGSWADVAMAFVYGAIAGGIVKGVTWAQGIFS